MQQKYEDLANCKMIARFFKNNDKLGFVLLPLLAVAIWAFSFIQPGFHTTNFSGSFLLKFTGPLVSSGFWKSLNLVFSIGGAYLLSILCIRQEISDKQNLLPSFLYLLFCGLLNINGAFHPMLAANLLIIGGFYLLFSTYREELALSEVFDAGFLLSLATLIYTPAVIFIPIPFIALIILKSFKLREWLLILCGFATPYLITSAILYISDQLILAWLEELKTVFVPFHLPYFGKGSFLIHTAIVLFLLLGFYNSVFRSGNFKIKTQKVKSILIWILLTGLTAVPFVNASPFFKGIFLIIPLSIFAGDYLGNIKKGFLREFLTVLLLAAWICSNLQAAGYL